MALRVPLVLPGPPLGLGTAAFVPRLAWGTGGAPSTCAWGAMACAPVLQSSHNVGIINVGAPAAGMNAAVRSAVRVGISNGHKMFAIYDGFEGFARGQVGPRGCAWRRDVPVGSMRGNGGVGAVPGAHSGCCLGPPPGDGCDCARGGHCL